MPYSINGLPVDIPPSGGNYLPPTSAPYHYGDGGMVQLNPGGGTSFGYTQLAPSPDYSQVNWDALSRQYPGTGNGAYTATPSASINAGDGYRPPINGFFGHTPPGAIINGLAALGNGHFLDATPIGRLLSSVGHLFNGTLGQHAAGGGSGAGGGNGGGGNAGFLPTLQFNSSGQVLNGLPGGWNTVAGIDPRTGNVVMNGGRGGDAPGGGAAGGGGAGASGSAGLWNGGFGLAGGGNIAQFIQRYHSH
jgi:hypothetical protein